MRNKMVSGEEATGFWSPGLEEGIHKSKPDSQRVTGTESDLWREGKEGRVKPTSLPEARVEAGAHGRILQNKKTTTGLHIYK